jgi:hypothetical protein
MDKPMLLSNAPLEHPAMDYAYLRQEGIRYLERMAGQVWTDFNAHDPGITILEQLCYAITDLGYRINYDLKDLLATGTADPYHSIYSPAEVLTTNPVTLTDLRKLVIDVGGVKNAWIEPVEEAQPALYYDSSDQSLYLEAARHRVPVQLRGLYRVLIEADSSRADLDIVRQVQQRLHSCRSLGEDFVTPIILRQQPISVIAEIEAGMFEDAEQLLAQIYHTLASFISPRIRFYSLDEMLARGKRIDEIMDGPVLQHGFIDTAELEGFNRKTGLRTSDFIQEIMRIAGVQAVNTIQLAAGDRADDWYLNLQQTGSQDSTPMLDIATSRIELVRNGAAVRVDASRVRRIFSRLQQFDQPVPMPETQRDIRLSAGRDRDIGRYHSIQHQFPPVYGIGEMGLPASASPQRQAQARQLKAYLLFFDQVLANFFAQLAHVNELFSFQAPDPRTYFAQPIDDVRLGLDDIWIQDAAHAANVQASTADPASELDQSDQPNMGRKHRFLNHLLARFAEEFTDDTFQVFAQSEPEELIAAKSTFLRDYRELGAARGRAFNYTRPAAGSQNASGLENRISHKLGLLAYQQRKRLDPEKDDIRGFYMVESILLRPQQADLDQWAQDTDLVGWQSAVLLALPPAEYELQHHDPFSARLCFVFPDVDTMDRALRSSIERMLREETPAHLALHVQWLSPEHMRLFEAAYQDWLDSLTANADRQAALDNTGRNMQFQARAARDLLIDRLNIGRPYPLRDGVLRYDEMVALDQPAEIEIQYAQIGVRYQLCDDDGNPISDFDAMRPTDQTDTHIILKTPPIIRDSTFTILATRSVDGYGAPLHTSLEIYLTTHVSIKVGINAALPVEFRPGEGQVSTGQQITITYNDTASVAVSASQEGISYRLVTATDDGETILSDAVEGNKAVIVLETSQLAEDTVIQVQAYRTRDPGILAYLDTTLTVNVRPNLAVGVQVAPSAPPIVEYAGQATLSLVGWQRSVTYRLYRRTLAAADYVAANTPERLEVPTDTGQSVFVQAPQTVTDWDNLSDFVLVGTFQEQDGDPVITAEDIREDTIFLVQATKNANREHLQLHQAVVVLARPDPAPQVAAMQSPLQAGSPGMVTVSETQQGVAYQLQVETEDTPINLPGYDYRDRGIDTVRLEVDLVVEEPVDPDAYQTLLLPAGPVSASTTYSILATKMLSGVSTLLNNRATIEVDTHEPTDENPADDEPADDEPADDEPADES